MHHFEGLITKHIGVHEDTITIPLFQPFLPVSTLTRNPIPALSCSIADSIVPAPSPLHECAKAPSTYERSTIPLQTSDQLVYGSCCISLSSKQSWCNRRQFGFTCSWNVCTEDRPNGVLISSAPDLASGFAHHSGTTVLLPLAPPGH